MRFRALAHETRWPRAGWSLPKDWGVESYARLLKSERISEVESLKRSTMEDGLDRGRWTAADKHLGQAQVDVKRYIRPRALPEDSLHETKCRTFNKRWANHKFSCEESRSWMGRCSPRTEDQAKRFQFGARDEAGRDWNSSAVLAWLGFAYRFKEWRF